MNKVKQHKNAMIEALDPSLVIKRNGVETKEFE